MGSVPSRARFESAVTTGNDLLARYGYPQRGTAAELEAWLQTDTPYPNPDASEVLASRFLVVHEIVEIDQAKRMGLRITKDVIVRNMEAINDAHLVAAEVELRIAAREDDVAHVASRFAHLRSWCDDPLLTDRQRAAYEAFRGRVERWLDAASRGRQTEEL